MKLTKLFLALFCTLSVAGYASAQGAYNIAKQQANNAANNQGTTAPAAPPPQAMQPDPALQATLRNINNLRVDFEDFASNPTNTLPLQADLNDAAQGTKPAKTAVAQLAQDLAAVIAGHKSLHPKHPKLAQYVHAIFNSSHLTTAQQQMILDNVQKILSDGAVPADDATKVISDLKTIATETQ